MKKNKIFKALGVGALVTLGLFIFTGCSLIDNADVVSGLKNNNSNLEKVIESLKEENRLLREQNQTAKSELEESKKENEILQDYLEEVQNENSKITAEEALDMLLLAENKFITNYNGIRDNLKIFGVEDNDDWYAEHTMEYYQSENNGYVYI